MELVSNKEYLKKYRERNKEELKEYERKYHQKHEKKIKEYQREYHQKHKKETKEYYKTYNKKHYIINKQKRRKYISDNRIHIKNKRTEYRNKNPEVFLRASIKHLERLRKPLNLSSKEYRHAIHGWSNSVKNHDYNICQICGSLEDLNSHHLFHKNLHPKLSLNLNNGITLCKLCHNEVHGFNAYKPQKDTN